jgi:hypothetical protein
MPDREAVEHFAEGCVMRPTLTRVCVAVALVAGVLPATAPVASVRASCGTIVGSGIGLDPVLSRSDLTATPSVSYNWAGICGFTGGGAIAPDGGAEAAFTIGLGPLPPFPTAAGALGVTVMACADMSAPIASQPVVIGTDHRGRPVFDGPYPPEDGYKWCTWATLQSGAPLDYGVGIYDSNGIFSAYDYPELATGDMSSPSGFATGSSSVTLYLPKTFTFLVDAPPPPLLGVSRTYNEPMIGSSTNNALVLTKIEDEVTLPTGSTCVNFNPIGLSCNGNQAVGPIFGVASFAEGISGWAPGSITCGGVVGGLPDPATCSVGPGGTAVDLGILPLPPGTQAVPTCVDPFDPGVVECASESGATTYNPCQSTNTPGGQDVGDLYAVTSAAGLPCPQGSVRLPYAYLSLYGRIWPGEAWAPRIQGFTLGPALLPTGVNF